MTDFLGLTASAASGGVFGLLGTALGRVAGFFERRQHHAQERARWVQEAKLLQMQAAARAEDAKAERAPAETSGRWQGLQSSIAADAAIGQSYLWVSAIRGLTRPALTLHLWGIAAAIYASADGDGRAAITETATLWWFGDRGPRREPRR